MAVCSRMNVIKFELCQPFEDPKVILFLEGSGRLKMVWIPKDV